MYRVEINKRLGPDHVAVGFDLSPHPTMRLRSDRWRFPAGIIVSGTPGNRGGHRSPGHGRRAFDRYYFVLIARDP